MIRLKTSVPFPARSSLALVALAAVILAPSLSGTGRLQASDAVGRSTQQAKYSLLVGCTEYPNCQRVPELWGPSNDIPLYADLLSDTERGFGFAEENIKRLVGWPDDPDQRPTYANIVAAFEELVAKAAPNTQIFILLAGHGVQVPVPDSADPLDPANPEPDGMDEVFLPADVESWGPSGLKNALRDDQIGEWLAQMRKQGANVWIVFDCCHSGSMSRGTESLERVRAVRPRDLGIPDEVVEKAVSRARRANGERSRGLSRFEGGALGIQPDEDSQGSVVAFYAAQEWEETPELPRPRDAPRTREHYFGLMSYTLTKCLQQQRNPLTYRELSQLLVSHYRADRGSRGPTPSFEGDLEREVLGTMVMPAPEIILQRKEGRLGINAGELSGVTRGCVLAVHPPANDQRDPDAVLGHVRVAELTPISAEVEPCTFAGKPKVPESEFPELARCKIADWVVGDMRVSLTVAEPTDPGDAQQVAMVADAKAALEQMPERVRALISVPDDNARADWVLRVVTPSQALRNHGLAIDEPRVMLFQGVGRDPNARAGPDSEGARSVAQVNARKIFGQYPANDPQRLADEIARDVSKIFTWRNVWRIAGAMGGGGDDTGMVFEVAKLKRLGDPGEPLTETCVQSGQILEYRFRNEGYKDLWVTAIALDANFGIEVYFSRSLKDGASLKPIPVRISDKSTRPDGQEVTSVGTEGLVVFAVRMDSNRASPDYEFLAQSPLGVTDPVHRGENKGGQSPFELMLHAASSKGYGTRGSTMLVAPDNPAVLSHSWITVPSE